MLPLLLFLIGCATVYVATMESAFGSMVRLSERVSAERGIEHKSLATYLEDPLRLFVATRFLRAVLFAMAAVVLVRMIGAATPREMGLLLLATLIFAIVCEQLVPSMIVQRDPVRTLEWLLPSFDAVLRVVDPFTGAVLRLTSRPRTRPEAGTKGNGHSEIDPHFEDQAAEEAAHDSEARKLLQSVVDFGGTLVREVMTPRPDIVAITHTSTVAEFRALFAEEEYSRIPVFKENLDNIVGFVFAKDLVTLDGVPGESKIVARLLRPAHIVPEGTRVADLLSQLRLRHLHSAIVVDEYGGTTGLVTIEDLLEEIVGEIRDEYDGDESEPILDEGNGVFLFLGNVSVADLVERLGVLVEREGFETVGGYLLTRLGRVPRVGEIVEVDELVVEVLEAERRRVRRVRVRRRDTVTSRLG